MDQIRRVNFNTIKDSEEKITKEAIKSSSAKIFSKGTLLIALYGATVGRLAFLGIDAATNQAIAAIFTPQNLSNKFLYWYLFSYRENLLKQRIGGAQPNISQGTLKNIPIPLPPLPEQKKIVEKIEELFSGLDSGVASLRKTKEQLRLYRQSVLAEAFSGKLTTGHSELVSESKKLKQVQLDKLELPEGLPAEDLAKAGWKWVKLGELISPSKERFEPLENDNQKYIGLEHIEKGTGKILGNENSDTVRSTKTIFSKGDLLYGKLRPYLNKVTIAEFNGVCSTDILVFNKREGLSNSFLKYRMLMEDFVSYAQNHMSGVQHPRINFRSLSEYDLMLPDYNQQLQIVEEIESRFAGSEALEKAIDESLTKAEILRQSILKQAFEGKLI